MWIAKTGAPWRYLPDEYGKWSTVHKIFIRWSNQRVWQMIFNTFTVDADTEWLMMDSKLFERINTHRVERGSKPNR
jgi:transposase